MVFIFCLKYELNLSKNLSGTYSQKRLDHAKQSARDALKILQKE